MNRKEWDALERVVKDQLASRWGLTRSGENNETMVDEELTKIPEEKEEVKEVTKEENEPKKKSRKVSIKKSTKRSK